MRDDTNRRGLKRVLGIIQWIAAFFLVIVAASLKADVSKYQPPLSGLLGLLQGVAWWCIPTLALAAGVTQFFQKRINQASTWGSIRFLLNEFHKLIFGKPSGAIKSPTDTTHHKRVTLFQYKKRITFRDDGPTRHWYFLGFDWSGWLIPVQRSGHTTRRTSTAFWAPDAADKVQGIAGVTWANNQRSVREDLPDISQNSSTEDLKKYADDSWLTVEWLEKKLVRKGSGWPRALYGIPVEVEGKLWGVIVLDSRDVKIPNLDRIDAFHETYAKILSRFIHAL
ncbi:MAG: hypothetical protein JOZ08_12585 [Verrucomicrobia bacterium]|nr:hypothetical protein [Verrucomicrobiota bacterium]